MLQELKICENFQNCCHHKTNYKHNMAHYNENVNCVEKKIIKNKMKKEIIYHQFMYEVIKFNYDKLFCLLLIHKITIIIIII